MAQIETHSGQWLRNGAGIWHVKRDTKRDHPDIIEWLINEHYILKTKEKYPVLHSTYEGLHYSESLTKTKLEELKAYLEKDEA